MFGQDERVNEILERNVIPVNASVLNTHRDPHRTTEKYTETDDLGIIQEFNRQGWYITKYKEVHTHKESRQGFQKYLAIYEYLEGDGNIPTNCSLGKAQLLQKGSHDGSSLLEINAGFFTFACSNGLIVGDKLFDPVTIKHIGNIPLEICRVMAKFADTAPVIFNKVDEMSRRVLTPVQAIGFAKQAIALRFDGDKYTVNVDDVLAARRQADANQSLWSVFNRVQENLINPAATFKATSVDSKVRKVRKITNIDVSVRLNQDLWHLAEEYLCQ